ncbi:MAG: TRIC cation channel family protein [Oscillospiraceae bacterium]|nr:TRIC cation channel family protein [Oscillospiraceae bacterium]
MNGERTLFNTVVLVFELIGTMAFAVSGAVTAMKKEMDIFGVVILGLCTAVGGGAIRDITLGCTPPAMFTNPVYAVLAIVVSVIAFIPAVQSGISHSGKVVDALMLTADSIGLGIFTVVGIQTAMEALAEPSFFLLIFVGVITGVGGGIIRDVLAGNTPYVFVKHIYALASLGGAVVCSLLWSVTGAAPAMLIGAIVIIALRFCAARFRWSLPRAKIK